MVLTSKYPYRKALIQRNHKFHKKDWRENKRHSQNLSKIAFISRSNQSLVIHVIHVV